MTQLPRIAFGGVALTTQPSLGKALQLLQTAYDEGLTNFDTAPVYGQGYSEAVLGKFMKGKREHLTITSKFGLGHNDKLKLPSSVALPLNYLRKKFQKPPKNHQGNSPTKSAYRNISKKQLSEEFETSLMRLNTDYIDNYLIHEGTPNFLSPDALEYLMELKEKGKIKKIGMGVCYKNLLDLDEGFLKDWDILQYEGYDRQDVANIYAKFKSVQHVHHSLLRHTSTTDTENIPNADLPAYIMASQLFTYPSCSIIFSTSKQNHIIENLSKLETFYKRISENALHQSK